MKVSKSVSIAIMSVLGFILLGSGVVYASDGANPGDLLYPVDRLGENIKLALIWDKEEKIELELEYMEERIKELEAIKAENHEVGDDIDDEDYGRIKGLNVAIDQVAKQEDRLTALYEEFKKLYESGELSKDLWDKIEDKYEDMLEKKKERINKLTELDRKLEEKLEEKQRELEEKREEKEREEQEREQEEEREKEEREQEEDMEREKEGNKNREDNSGRDEEDDGDEKEDGDEDSEEDEVEDEGDE